MAKISLLPCIFCSFITAVIFNIICALCGGMAYYIHPVTLETLAVTGKVFLFIAVFLGTFLYGGRCRKAKICFFIANLITFSLLLIVITGLFGNFSPIKAIPYFGIIAISAGLGTIFSRSKQKGFYLK